MVSYWAHPLLLFELARVDDHASSFESGPFQTHPLSEVLQQSKLDQEVGFLLKLLPMVHPTQLMLHHL